MKFAGCLDAFGSHHLIYFEALLDGFHLRSPSSKSILQDSLLDFLRSYTVSLAPERPAFLLLWINVPETLNPST